MATVEEIADLRELVNEPDDSGGWTDARLDEYIEETRDEDGATNLNAAAAKVWLSKATTYSTLVNVSESGSSRQMSDLHKNALALHDRFAGQAASTDDLLATRPRTRAIVRP